MRTHILSAALGVAFGLLLSAGLETQPAAAKEKGQKSAPKKTQEIRCWDTASTQFDLNQCAAKDTQEVEAEMNAVLDKIAVAYKEHPTFMKHMKRSQEAWMNWMLLEVSAHYPADADGGYSWGSVRPMCQLGLQAGFIVERTQELQSWLSPSDREEGEVCGGIFQMYGAR